MGTEHSVTLSLDGVSLEGHLALPPFARSVVAFAHGSGSSRRSSRNRLVADELRRAGIGTLLFDLLTEDEDREPKNRFTIELLEKRLIEVAAWLESAPETRGLPIGLFGSSTGAAAALRAAAALGDSIRAVVSRGGRPDLAGDALHRVSSPTLLVVGAEDRDVLSLNERAYDDLVAVKGFVIIPGATHLFEEPGKLEEVAAHASSWFTKYLGSAQLARHAG